MPIEVLPICFIILGVAAILIAITSAIYRKIQDNKLLATATNRHRGTRTERELVLKMLKSNFDSRVVFHDLYVKRQHKGYAQIDMVIPTKVGIFVFEVKDYSGWIFGDCNQQIWTQILGYGRYKYRFYNPVKQNEGHILALRSQLQDAGDIPYYSIVVFYGSCRLKSINNTPPNTYVCYDDDVKCIIDNIITTSPNANYLDKRKVIDVLKAGVQNGTNPQIISEHLQSIY